MTIGLRRADGVLFVLSAPSGGGKSTVLRALLGNMEGLGYSVSVTSRAPRPGEKEGVDFHFVSVEEFHAMTERREFYEWARVHGNLYGTSRKNVGKLLSQGLDVAMDLDVQGARTIKGLRPDTVSIFLLPPSTAILEQRLRGRDTDDDAVIRTRLENAAGEIASCEVFDYLVVNDDIDRVISDIKGIICAERHRSSRLQLAVEDEPAVEQHLRSNPVPKP